MPKKPAQKAAPKPGTARKKKDAAPPAQMEQILRKFVEAISGGEPIVNSDIKTMWTSLQGPSPGDDLDYTEREARSDAQELAFDAMEATSKTEARKLARRAIALYPDCVDALMTLAGLDARSTSELIEKYILAIEAGERSLGEKFIRENKGDFWLLIETRPYMRAMEQLASIYFVQSMYQEAIGLYEKMLKLNPNDNQGVRDPLLGAYLCIDNLQGAGRLLQRYKKDSMANFAWGRVLERFLSGDSAGAAAALAKAREANCFVEPFLVGKQPVPRTSPEMYSPGSKEEAVLCMDNVGRAWALHKDAVFWLHDQHETALPPRTPSKAALKRIPIKGKPQ